MTMQAQNNGMLAAVAALVGQLEDGKMKAQLERVLRGEEPTTPKDTLRQEVVSGSEAAEVLHCTVRTVQKLAARGIIKRIVMPGSSRGCGYSRKSVEALVGVGA